MKLIMMPGLFVVLIDDEDEGKVSKYNWHVRQPKRGYDKYYADASIKINGRKATIKMHRLIVGVTDPKVQVDHIDGNGLNNQKYNLRIATNAQNARNGRSHCDSTSKYKGTSYDRTSKRWIAQLCLNGLTIYRDTFNSEIAAAKAYDTAARFYHGEFANLNFPKENCHV